MFVKSGCDIWMKLLFKNCLWLIYSSQRSFRNQKSGKYIFDRILADFHLFRAWNFKCNLSLTVKCFKIELASKLDFLNRLRARSTLLLRVPIKAAKNDILLTSVFLFTIKTYQCQSGRPGCKYQKKSRRNESKTPFTRLSHSTSSLHQN